MGNTVTKLSINNINLTPGNVLIEVDRVDADDAQSMEKGDGQIVWDYLIKVNLDLLYFN